MISDESRAEQLEYIINKLRENHLHIQKARPRDPAAEQPNIAHVGQGREEAR
jgi:hypothetical protein